MKIEIGKSYINRIGGIELFVGYDENENEYKSATGGLYCPDGKYLYSKASDYDLIKEVRVTIEEVEPVSEFESLKKFILQLDEERRWSSTDNALSEIERLQKLFEGGGKNEN